MASRVTAVLLASILLWSLNNFLLTAACILHGTEQLEVSLCKAKSCPYYGKCRIDESGFYAKCACPEECDLTDLSSTSQLFVSGYDSGEQQTEHDAGVVASRRTKAVAMPTTTTPSMGQSRSKELLVTNELFAQVVCGSDGLNYKNFCQLKKESCKMSRDIKIYYFGKCSK
jgi:hypothetical protein